MFKKKACFEEKKFQEEICYSPPPSAMMLVVDVECLNGYTLSVNLTNGDSTLSVSAVTWPYVSTEQNTLFIVRTLTQWPQCWNTRLYSIFVCYETLWKVPHRLIVLTSHCDVNCDSSIPPSAWVRAARHHQCSQHDPRHWSIRTRDVIEMTSEHFFQIPFAQVGKFNYSALADLRKFQRIMWCRIMS